MPGCSSTSRPRGLPSRVTGTPTTPSLGSKRTSSGTPSITGGIGVKRLQKEYENQKADSVHAKLGSQRSRSVHDLAVEAKEKDTRERNNLGANVNSNASNSSTPLRKSGVNLKGYSCGSKPSTPSRYSSGRPSLPSKRSLGTNTPTPTVSRRSGGTKLRVSGHALHDGCPSVTPDVICHKSWSNTCSPDMDVYGGRTETTSVSVAVRVRPFNARERNTGEDKSILEVLGNTITITQDSSTAQSFTFDHCFWSCDEHNPQYASQEDVYSTLAMPLLEKAYEGYNTCLFAYGQTGSGKSYTMLGEDSLRELDSASSVTAGVIPRFCADLIQRAHSVHAHNPPEGQLPHTQVEVELSYVEIYNEQIYDLLGGMSSAGGREPLRVREDPHSGPYVEGVACHAVSSMEHFMTWLMLGNKERSIAATGLNDKSSRSHAIFTLKLTQTQTEDVEGEELESSKVSVINLVDLAGSERVGASLSQGDRLKEGVFINKSLLTLGKVINALAESEGRRRPFIPYRESVLTFLLKESLGGNSRTAMIATVSPSEVNTEETRSTLRYAQQTRKIVNRNYINEDPTAVIIRSLKKEVERLRLKQLAKVPSLLFTGEDDLGEEQSHNKGEGGDKDKIIIEKEKHILEREKEMNQLIEAKEKEIMLLREQVKCQQLLNEKNKSLEQRLKEAERQQQQALETFRQMGVAEKNEEGPVLINLNEDPQLSEKLSFKLKIGTTCIGSSNCDLLLPDLHTDDTHCSIFNDKGCLKLFPKSGADTYINGKLVTNQVNLTHNDRLILDGIYFFKVSIPRQANKKVNRTGNVDFHFTKEELLKEQEKRLQKEADEALARSKAEMERELEWHKQQLLCDMEDAHTQLFEKEKRVCELEGAHWKLQQEKHRLEEKLNRDRQHQNSSTELSPGFLNPQSNFLNEVEAVLNESVMEVKKESNLIPSMLSFRIKEANQICCKLKKAYEFMIQEVLGESGLDVVVVVKDIHHHMTATLSPATFTDMLQLLRTSVKDGDTDWLENGICWEKAEDVTRVPGFLNKLHECSFAQNFNLSINSSFSTSSSSVFSYSKARKMSNLRHLSEMSIRESSPGDECRRSVGVAAVVHQVLETLPAIHLHTPILSSALSALSGLHEDAMHIKDHTTEPGHTLSDEELSKCLIQLLCHSQSVTSSISAASTSEAVAAVYRKDQFQDDIQNNLQKLSSCTSRLFQGVKTETESLVEETSASIIRLVDNLVQEVARLSLLTPLPMPDTSFLKPGGRISTKFTEGLRFGLECLIKQCQVATNKAAGRLATDKSLSLDSLSTAVVSAVNSVAAFLKKYTALNTVLEYEPKMSVENQRLKLVKWIDCIESAAETVTHLDASLMDIVNHAKMFQEGKIHESFSSCTKEVLKSLQDLMALAGLGPSSVGKGSSCLVSHPRRNPIVEELRSKGRQAIKEMEKLEHLLGNQNQTLEMSLLETPIKYKEKVLTQWPKNSNEFQIYLQHNSPFKSSLQSSFHREDKEKKVRFNVSHVSSVSFSSPKYGL